MSLLEIFVGTDKWQRDAGAEKVLDYTIRKHATCEINIHWMRAGDPEWPVSENGQPAGSWNLGRPVHLAWPKQGGWGTPFSGFRFAVPELMGFKGRAVYFDADMLVLGDVAELLTFPTPTGITCCHQNRTDVSVIDCSWFAGKTWWPSIAAMKPRRWRVFEYLQLLAAHGAISATLPFDWNCCDNGDEWKPSTKLLHFTHVPWQPYHPYPTVPYVVHPKREWAQRWFFEKEEADAAVG